MDITDDVLRLTGQRSVRAIAVKAGTPPASLHRQLRDNTVPLPTMVAICRAHGVNPLDMLGVMGFYSPAELAELRGAKGLGAYTDLELAGEVYRRTAEASSLLRAM